MKDDQAPTNRPDGGDHPGADDEQAEALSRAAREAVRQPADPRLEASFARLGLFTDQPERPPRPGEPVPGDAEAAPIPAPGRPSAPPAAPAPTIHIGAAAPAVDLEPLRVQLAVLQATVERLERSSARATMVLSTVLVTVAVLVVLVLARI